MGKYYDPSEVIKKGRALKIISPSVLGDLPLMVKDNEIVVAIFDNGIRKIAPDVTDRREFKEFYNAYQSGQWIEMDIYAYPKEELTLSTTKVGRSSSQAA